MEARRPRPYIPLVLAVAGTGFALLAAADKVFGLVHHPLHLATLAYVSLFGFLALAFLHGIPLPPARLKRLSLYTAILILNFLTAAYVFAWRVSADPTPVLLERELVLGDERLREGDRDGAHLAYQAAYRRYPDSLPVLMRLGAVNYQIGDFARARKYYTRAVQVAPAPSRWRALNDLGQTCWKLEQPAEAIRYYEEARAAGMPESELPEWHYRLGWAYFDLHDFDAAIQHYASVVEAGEKYVAASYYNIACAQAHQVRAARDPAQRARLVREAIANLRLAWDATTSPDEVEALRRGLVGPDEARDPDLEPLRQSPDFGVFLREVRSRS